MFVSFVYEAPAAQTAPAPAAAAPPGARTAVLFAAWQRAGSRYETAINDEEDEETISQLRAAVSRKRSAYEAAAAAEES